MVIKKAKFTRIFTYISGVLAAPQQEDSGEGASGRGVALPGDQLGHLLDFLGAL